jgi:selenocysteine lyase/cysteine desulfurase
MKPQDSNSSSDRVSTRRDFLKSTSAALAGGLATTEAFSATTRKSASHAEQCSFSALAPDFVYLNSGTEGSMPECVLSTLRDGHRKWASDPTTSYETDRVFGKHQELNREKVAAFLRVGKNNVCLTDNTTMGLSMTLMGLNFRPGDKVVTTNHEHNAMKSPLQVLQERLALRVETQPFPNAEKLSGMDSSALLDALFPNSRGLRGARALCVSHVYPSTGVRLPLAALREKADELEIDYLVVDGAQAMGMLDLSQGVDDLKNSDFYACPGHKWLNGPPSTGVLYVRNENIRPPEFYPTISQRMGMYASCDGESDPCFPVAEALQVRGCSNTPGFAAMISAMNFAVDMGGVAQVEKHILGLSRKVKNGILSRAPRSIVSPHSDSALSSGLTVFFPFRWDKPETTFRDKNTADRVVRKLLDRNIQLRSIGFPDAGSSEKLSDDSYALRASTGYFNTASDIEFFEHALQAVLTRIG